MSHATARHTVFLGVTVLHKDLSLLKKGGLYPDCEEHSNIVLNGKLYRLRIGLARSPHAEEPENLVLKIPYEDIHSSRVGFDERLEEIDRIEEKYGAGSYKKFFRHRKDYKDIYEDHIEFEDRYIADKYYIPITLSSVIDFFKLPEKIAKQYVGIPDGYFPKKEAQLIDKCFSCGNWASYKFTCNFCVTAGRDGHLKTAYSNLYCGSRYCFSPACVADRFAGNVEVFESIGDLKGLREMWHMSFDTELLDMDEFRNNFSAFKKGFEYAMSNFWARMKKKGAACFWRERGGKAVCLPAIRVLDFSFKEYENGKCFVHYHFGVIPPKSGTKGRVMKMMNEVLNDILKRQRNKFLFNWHEHKCSTTKSGYTPIKGILSYLAKRAAGMYKFGEGKNLEWDSKKGKMRKDIEAGKYFGLQDFLTVSEYAKHFHGRRHYATVGGLPRGSNRTDNIESEMPTYCPDCKKNLARCDISVRITLNVPPDDPGVLETIKRRGFC